MPRRKRLPRNAQIAGGDEHACRAPDFGRSVGQPDRPGPVAGRRPRCVGQVAGLLGRALRGPTPHWPRTSKDRKAAASAKGDDAPVTTTAQHAAPVATTTTDKQQHQQQLSSRRLRSRRSSTRSSAAAEAWPSSDPHGQSRHPTQKNARARQELRQISGERGQFRARCRTGRGNGRADQEGQPDEGLYRVPAQAVVAGQ